MHSWPEVMLYTDTSITNRFCFPWLSFSRCRRRQIQAISVVRISLLPSQSTRSRATHRSKRNRFPPLWLHRRPLLKRRASVAPKLVDRASPIRRRRDGRAREWQRQSIRAPNTLPSRAAASSRRREAVVAAAVGAQFTTQR